MADILKRTTLIVRDIEIAAAWYEQVFGMTRLMDTPFTLSGAQLAAGAKGDQTRLIILKCDDDTIGMIGLLQWVGPAMDAPEELPTRVTFGAPIFVVAAEDCRATVERARAAGSRIHCEPRDWSVTGFDGKLQAMVGGSFF
ncbi:MAG: VOC family protein, partial [Proteobacteria bacterium]|nr:VOC family protein [Pseudomonadota bacterium]